MYASGPWFIYKWEVTLKLFVDPTLWRVSISLLWNGNEEGLTWKAGFSRWRKIFKMELKGFTLFYTPPLSHLVWNRLEENVNEIPSSFLIFQSPGMFISG